MNLGQPKKQYNCNMIDGYIMTGTYEGRTPTNQNGYFMFHIQTTKPKKSAEDGIKPISVPFQGNRKVAEKLETVEDGDIINVFIEITTKKGHDITYVNLLACDISEI